MRVSALSEGSWGQRRAARSTRRPGHAVGRRGVAWHRRAWRRGVGGSPRIGGGDTAGRRVRFGRGGFGDSDGGGAACGGGWPRGRQRILTVWPGGWRDRARDDPAREGSGRRRIGRAGPGGDAGCGRCRRGARRRRGRGSAAEGRPACRAAAPIGRRNDRGRAGALLPGVPRGSRGWLGAMCFPLLLVSAFSGAVQGEKCGQAARGLTCWARRSPRAMAAHSRSKSRCRLSQNSAVVPK